MNTAITQVLTFQNIGAWSKKDLTELAQASVDDVAETGEDVLGLIALAAKLEHYAGEVKKAAKAAGINDLAKYGRAGVAKGGVKLVLKETGVRYDYSQDRTWQIRNQTTQEATAKRKEWEDLLSVIPKGGMVITDPDTGEEYHAYAPARTGTESIQATIL